MRNNSIVIIGLLLLFMISCTSRKNSGFEPDSEDSALKLDSIATVTIHQQLPDDFKDGHMPPPPLDGRGYNSPPPRPLGGKRPDGPPPHENRRPPHMQDNMRGFDPASEDDMDDNGMSRYIENDDEDGWD